MNPIVHTQKTSQTLLRRMALTLIVLPVVLLAAISPATPTLAETNSTTVSVELATLTIQGCETVEVEVWINDVVDLYAADVTLSFDPSILTVVDSDGNIPGIQVANGGFLAPPVIAAVNDANNTTGVIQYAATQLNPTLPATGSGPFMVIQFQAKQAGTSPIQITYTKLSDREAEEIPSSGSSDGSITANTPAAPPLDIFMLNPTTAQLSWTAGTGVAESNLYREILPYFTPTPPAYQTILLPTLSYDDVGAIGASATNNYYVLTSVCGTGFESAISNRVGEFDFDLVPGSP